MDIEVELISRETIKPSSPTPDHKRKFPLSLMDQLNPPLYTRMILFYANCGDDSVILKLKQALSQTLVHFYPLAGSVRDNLYIECDDQGLSFSETRVTNYDLPGFLKEPNPQMFNHLLPFQEETSCPVFDGREALQVNIFLCGGVAIGISLLHKVIDGILISQFLNKWAYLTRMDDHHRESGHASTNNNTVKPPAYILFPCTETLPSNASAWEGNRSLGKAKLSGQRFLFDANAITSIRDEAKSEIVPNPTVVEALSGFIWRCMIKASRAKSGISKSVVVAHSVNIRPIMVPAVANDLVGNLYWKAMASYRDRTGETLMEPELGSLVILLRKSFSDMKNGGCVEKLKGAGGLGEVSRWLNEVAREYMDDNVEAYSFTSWCRMGFNEVDFGWGRPAWVAAGGPLNVRFAFDGGALLVEASRGEEREVEAWVSMEEEKMSLLVRDPEFLAAAALNPTISII